MSALDDAVFNDVEAAKELHELRDQNQRFIEWHLEQGRMLTQLRAENKKLRNTLCLDGNDRPTKLWELFDKVESLEKCLFSAQQALLSEGIRQGELRAELEEANSIIEHAKEWNVSIIDPFYKVVENWLSKHKAGDE